jgi:hypothetical protein
MEWDRETEEATSSTFHLQLQLSRSIGLVVWHCKVTRGPDCVELATPSFWESVTHSFPSAQVSLHFDWKWPPPGIQTRHSHEDGHCFSSYKCIPGFQSCQTTSVSVLEEVDKYETVFWSFAEHWCMNLFSCAQSRKSSSLWETSFPKIAEPGGKDRSYRDIPPILKSLRNWLFADIGYMLICFVVSSYFIGENVLIIYGHSVLFIYTALYYIILHYHAELWQLKGLHLYTQSATTSNTALLLIYTLYSSLLHAHSHTHTHTHTHRLKFLVFTSRILATDFNTVVIPVSLQLQHA